MKRRTVKYLKCLFVIMAYAIVIYKVCTYNNYVELLHGVASFTFSSLLSLAFLMVLLPVNILLESKKWQTLVAPICRITLRDALRSVLIGVVGGVSTPNRLGDFPVRTLSLPEDARAASVTVGFVGSWIQTMVISIFGFSSIVLLMLRGDLMGIDMRFYLTLVVLVLLLLVVFFALLPLVAKKLMKKYEFAIKVKNIFSALRALGVKQFAYLFLLTASRYLVYSFQFYLALCAFGVELTPLQAMLSIFSMYLLITITPSFAFTDLIVRTSYSVMMIGLFSSNVLAISLASTLVWLVNCFLPMILGSLILLKTRPLK